MPTLLVVDDEPSILHAFRRAFHELDVVILTAPSAAKGIEAVVGQKPDAVVLDVKLPDLSGVEAFRRIKEIDARIPVIFITGHGTTDTAIEAIKLGAIDYLLKPLDLSQLRKAITSAFEISRRMRVPATLGEDLEPTDVREDLLVGRCPAMQEVYKSIGRVAQQDVTVLIEGESGTGKELVARAIYQHSRRSSGPFLAINCAAIPEMLLESELFGHEKGAFTGADRLRIGKFEQCSEGTLLLDEIGDMSPMTQAKILRVLQEQRFERVGGNQTIRTDCRLIAATNKKLRDMVAAGHFRSDLYYRIGGFSIWLPPLRERGDDLPMLVNHFLRLFNRQLGKEVRSVSPQVMELFRKYPWPGNVRELQSVMMAAMLHARGSVLIPEFLPALFVAEDPTSDRPGPVDWAAYTQRLIKAGSTNVYSQALQAMERQLITAVLRTTNGNQVQAAKILGITRGNLRNKIKSLGITIDRWIWSQTDQDGGSPIREI